MAGWRRPCAFLTSKERDTETGLDFFGARYLASAQGRFTGVDQGDPDVENPQSLNRFCYTFNNPLRYVDPDGNQAEAAALVAFGTATGAPAVAPAVAAAAPVVAAVVVIAVVAGGALHLSNWAETVHESTWEPRDGDGIRARVFMPPIAKGNIEGVARSENAQGEGDKSTNKPSLTDHKEALKDVHKEVGKRPKGDPGKKGSPQRGDSKRGYRLDPPHPGKKPTDPESKPHINYWDYTEGKRGKGGKSGAVPIPPKPPEKQ